MATTGLGSLDLEAKFIAALLESNEDDWRPLLEARRIELFELSKDKTTNRQLVQHQHNPLIEAPEPDRNAAELFEDGGDQLVPLPARVASVLRATIYGPWPGPPTPAKAIAWEATYTLGAMINCWIIVRLVPDVYVIAAMVMVVELVFCQAPLLWTGANRMRAGGWGSPTQPVSFLQEPVASETAEIILSLTKQAMLGPVLFTLTVGPFGVLCIYVMWPPPIDVLVPIIVLMLLLPFSGFRWQGNSFPGQVACEVLRGRAQQLARRISKGTAATTDYGSVAADIHTLHKDCEHTAWVLEPGAICNLQFSVAFTIAVMILALGPQAPPDHPMSRYVPPELRLAVAALFLVGGAYGTLSGPAKLTAALDEIASALNSLRRDGSSMPHIDNLARIEALERYVSRLADGGLGYRLLGARISYGFLARAMVSIGSGAVVLFPILLVLVREVTSIDGAMGSLSM
jgi:hypothetical protein